MNTTIDEDTKELKKTTQMYVWNHVENTQSKPTESFVFLVVEEEKSATIHHLLRLNAESPVLAAAAELGCVLIVAGCTQTEQATNSFFAQIRGLFS